MEKLREQAEFRLLSTYENTDKLAAFPERRGIL
jgi:hypothetical protein